jgi:hypothetical protein
MYYSQTKAAMLCNVITTAYARNNVPIKTNKGHRATYKGAQPTTWKVILTVAMPAMHIKNNVIHNSCTTK